MASCGPLDRGLPLDALLRSLAGLLRKLGPERAADLLGPDEALLRPLLTLAPVPGRCPGSPMACSAPPCCTRPCYGFSAACPAAARSW